MDDQLRAFLIFDRNCDGDLRNEMMEQAGREELPFSIVGESMDDRLDPRRDERLRTQIREADQVVVICGQHTAASAAVGAEFQIALEEDKPYLLIWGRRNTACTKPAGAKPGDGMYKWALDILELRNHDIERRLRARPAARLNRPVKLTT
jgi:hypothetical protein